MKKRAQEIQEQQSKLNKELRKIQRKCSHKDQQVRFDYINKRHMWYCVECELAVRYPSGCEIHKFIHS